MDQSVHGGRRDSGCKRWRRKEVVVKNHGFCTFCAMPALQTIPCWPGSFRLVGQLRVSQGPASRRSGANNTQRHVLEAGFWLASLRARPSWRKFQFARQSGTIATVSGTNSSTNYRLDFQRIPCSASSAINHALASSGSPSSTRRAVKEAGCRSCTAERCLP
jgi:hypothetical protein